ncbi:MAG: hypothetical protein M3Q10_08260 [Chloroflexota bacterium]|nr:hypothetical protein [Chloroflexota bacterium]
MNTTQTKTRRAKANDKATANLEALLAAGDNEQVAEIAAEEAAPTIDLPDGDDGSVGSIEEARVQNEAARRERKPRKASEPKSCLCSCGGLTAGGDFLPGHDQRHRGNLARAARNGDIAAKDELDRRGWDWVEHPVNGKLSDEQKAEKERERLQAKLTRARLAVAELEDELAAMEGAPAETPAPAA